jgi:hypothetical protein
VALPGARYHGAFMGPAGRIPSRNGVRQRMSVRAMVGLLIAVAVGVLVSGCGGSNAEVGSIGTAGRSSSHSSASSSYAQALVFAKCVRTHGVRLWPAPDSDGQFDKSKLTPQQLGVSGLQAAAAQRACRSSLPTYSAAEGSSQVATVVTAALRFSRCMRAHGSTNFPDPKANGAIVIPHAMENSPVYLAALRTCIRKYGVPPPPSAAG